VVDRSISHDAALRLRGHRRGQLVLTTMPSATAWVQDATGLALASPRPDTGDRAPAAGQPGGRRTAVIAMPIRVGDPDDQLALFGGHLDPVDCKRDPSISLLGFSAAVGSVSVSGDISHLVGSYQGLSDSRGAVRPSM